MNVKDSIKKLTNDMNVKYPIKKTAYGSFFMSANTL